ncbi:MAG: dihydrofolate reductase family protein [Chloroflexi bacterium]|nr:dihydrofolate reductase family protein [Chloroflexota bacterium]
MPRPYVIVNVAASADGKIDTFERRGAAISSQRDRERVDALRAAADAVMVGSRTVVDEDPRLTVKSAELRAGRLARGKPENPAKVAVVSRLGFKPNGQFLTAGPARIIVFTPAPEGTLVDRGEDALQSQWAALGVEIFTLGAGRVDLGAAMQTLGQLGVRSVLVEGGGSLNFELLRFGLVDEVQVFVAPVIFGGGSAPTLADGSGLVQAAALKLERVDVDVWQDGGVVLRYKVKPRE